jgi:hypothetical protein
MFPGWIGADSGTFIKTPHMMNAIEEIQIFQNSNSNPELSKFPQVSYLQRLGDLLYKLTTSLDTKGDSEFTNRFKLLRDELDLFVVDLSNIEDDEIQQLEGYKPQWLHRYSELIGLKYSFMRLYKDINKIEMATI